MSRQKPDLTALRHQLYARCRGRCERCALTLDSLEVHHRKLRSQGGTWQPSNLLALHSECHRYVHANPTLARRCGWLVSAYADPAAQPVLQGGSWWLLDDACGRAAASPG